MKRALWALLTISGTLLLAGMGRSMQAGGHGPVVATETGDFTLHFVYQASGDYTVVTSGTGHERWIGVMCSEVLRAAGPAPGEPCLPYWIELAAAPPDAEIEISWTCSDTRLLGRGRLMSVGADGIPADVAVSVAELAVVVAPATIIGEAQARQTRLAAVRIRPFLYDDDTGALTECRRIDIDITMKSGSGSGPRAANAWCGEDRLTSAMLSRIANPQQAARWRIPLVAKPAPHRSRTDGPRVKLAISSPGLYQLPAGWIPAGTSTSAIQLSSCGLPVPLDIFDGNDGIWDEHDNALFYGSGHVEPDGAPCRYTDTNIYWLSWGTGPNARFPEWSANEPGHCAASAYWETVHCEQNLVYADQDFFWQSLFAADVGEFPVTMDEIGPDLPARLRFRLKGITAVATAEPDHHAEVRFNGTVVCNVFWDGIDECIGEAEIPRPQAVDGHNVIRVTCPGDTDAGILDAFYIDWFELRYARRYTARGNYLNCRGPVSGATELADYRIDGFSNADIRVYQVEPLRRIEPVTPVVSGEGYAAMFTAPGATELRFVAAAAGSELTVDQSWLDEPSDWATADHGADYLIITGADFAAELAPLVDFRREQGLRVETVLVEDIVDEFSHGIFHPEALREFVSYAYHSWQAPPCSYLLLAGDASWDYKGYLPGGADRNIVPAYGKHWPSSPIGPGDRSPTDSSDFLYGAPMVDDQFVCIAGDDNVPDLAIGRLPAAEAGELRVMVEKTLAYERQQRDASWQRRIILINGGVGDHEQAMFRTQSETLWHDCISPYPAPLRPVRIYRETDTYDWGEYTGPIASAINAGALVINFLGHAGTWSWETMFGYPDIVRLENYGRLPFVASMTCNTARFANPDVSSFGEAFVCTASSETGAAAFWGGSNFGGYWSDYYLAYFFYDALFAHKRRIAGEAIWAAKVQSLCRYPSYAIIIEPYTLLGDPALAVDLPSAPIVAAWGVVPAGFASDESVTAQFLAVILDPSGPETVSRVELALDGIPLGILLRDDGISGDSGYGDCIYGCQLPIAHAITGTYAFELTAEDLEGNLNMMSTALIVE